MALTNESYIVTTATTGDVIVPVKEQVTYLNIELLGYQFFNYHEVMSQNLINIVDDIKALQDGGLAQATFDLDLLIAEANATIDTKIDLLLVQITDKIITETAQAVDQTNIQLADFNAIINGDGVNPGIVERITTNETTIGDVNSGIVKQLNQASADLGDGTSGLIFQVSELSTSITDTTIKALTNEADLATIDVVLNGSVTGLVPRLSTLEITIGDAGSGLVKQSQLSQDMLFGDGTYAGLLAIIGDNTSGLVKDVNDNAANLLAEIESTTPRLNNIELRLGNLNESGLIGEVDLLQAWKLSTDSILGATATEGLQLRVQLLEDFDISSIKASIYDTTTGLIKITTDLRTDIDSLQNQTSSDNTTVNSSIAAVEAKADQNILDIASLNTLTSSHTSSIAVIDDDINNATTGIIYRLNNILASDLTYDNAGTPVAFTPAALFAMKTETDAAAASDLNARFVSYFGDSLNAQLPIEIGRPAIDAWSVDTTATGLERTIEPFIGSYVSSTWDMAQIDINRASIDIINADILTVGSIKYEVSLSLSPINESIVILEGDDTVAGSVDNKIKLASEVYDANLQATTILDLQNKIIDIETVHKNEVEELQVELARYDTILPFFQKMFKYVNNQGSITDAEIDTIFTTVVDKVAAVGATLTIQDYQAYLNTTTSQFEVIITLDRDFEFYDDGVKALVNIIRLDDDYNTGEIVALVDLIDPRKVLIATTNVLYVDVNDTTGIVITDLTGINSSINLAFQTIDIFGTIVEHLIPLQLKA